MRLSASFRFALLPIMLASGISLWAQRPTEKINGHDALAGEVIVKFRTADPNSRNVIQALATASSPERLSHLDQVYLLRSRGKSAQQILALLKSRAELEYVEPNYVLRSSA